jgi:hypothetical protein
VSLANPSSSLLSGLHKDIRVRKLTLADKPDRPDRTEEQKDQLCAALSLVSKSQQFGRVVDLTLKVGPCDYKIRLKSEPSDSPPSAPLQSMHLDLEAALHLSPLLHGIEALHLQGCKVDKRSLAVLGNCKHLIHLTLVNIQLAAGAAESLQVLAAEGSPGLQLTLDLTESSQESDVLAALAPRVTQLSVKTTTIKGMRTALNTIVQRQFPRLRYIHLHGISGAAVSLPLMGIRQLVSACPQLHSLTCKAMVLLDLHCLRALMEMPQLQQLTVHSVQVGPGEPPMSIRWPANKQPMSLSLGSTTPSQLSALPLEHCSHVCIGHIDPPAGQTRQQLADGMRAALLNAARCPQVQVAYVIGSGQQPAAGAGLSALTADCPLQLKRRQGTALANVALESEDVQGLAAAWGRALQGLVLNRCTLSASAWAALASDLPALKSLGFSCIKDVQQLGAHMAAFLVAWPSNRKLRVQVPGDVATQWLSTWSDILRAHQHTAGGRCLRVSC